MTLLKKISLPLLACCCLAGGWFPAVCRAEGNEAVIQRYVSMAIQGDLTEAAELFSASDAPADPVLLSLRAQFDQRFHAAADPVEETVHLPFPDGVSQAYRDYWREGLLGPSSREQSEARLEDRLSDLLFLEYGKRVRGEDLFTSLRQAYRENGLGFFDSPDPPLRDLFLWRSEEQRRYTVRLTDGPIDLEVRFLDGLLLQGWKDFASLGLATTTGWVENGLLYCLDWAYDRDSENFQVSYLQHEARHLADLQRWPGLDSTELEYRAKLTELAFANRSMRRVLDDFSSKAAQNPASPHAMANWRVVNDLYMGVFGREMPVGFENWGEMRTWKVRRVARRLLEESSRRIEEQA